MILGFTLCSGYILKCIKNCQQVWSSGLSSVAPLAESIVARQQLSDQCFMPKDRTAKEKNIYKQIVIL